MFEDTDAKLKRKNAILFSRESACFNEFLPLVRKQKHRTLVLWAFECVQPAINELRKKYPSENRFLTAFELCRQWARGEVTMPAAKRAILDCHSACKNWDDPADIALCHCVGQGLSTVHVETHAIGLAIYELSAIVFRYPADYPKKVAEKVEYYTKTLLRCQNSIDKTAYPWAGFLLNDRASNKEDALWIKTQLKTKDPL